MKVNQLNGKTVPLQLEKHYKQQLTIWGISMLKFLMITPHSFACMVIFGTWNYRATGCEELVANLQLTISL
jgi:hypothetical protein